MTFRLWRIGIVAALLLALPSMAKAQGVETRPQTQPAQTQPTASPQTLPAAPMNVSWDIAPCSRFGPIQANASAAELVKIFGKENVQDVQIEGPEGESFPGTAIFPNDPTKKLQIIWKDAATKGGPVDISLSGDKSVWKTGNGVTLGMGLKDLEKLNGAPFTMSGFGWDYGGHVVSWEQGALAKIFPQKFSLMLDPKTGATITDNDLKAVSGDKNFKSNNPVLQAMNPKVVEISCSFQ